MAVACGRGALANNTYTLTRTGLVCLFDARRVLDRFTEVKVSNESSSCHLIVLLGDSPRKLPKA